MPRLFFAQKKSMLPPAGIARQKEMLKPAGAVVSNFGEMWGKKFKIYTSGS